MGRGNPPRPPCTATASRPATPPPVWTVSTSNLSSRCTLVSTKVLSSPRRSLTTRPCSLSTPRVYLSTMHSRPPTLHQPSPKNSLLCSPGVRCTTFQRFQKTRQTHDLSQYG